MLTGGGASHRSGDTADSKWPSRGCGLCCFSGSNDTMNGVQNRREKSHAAIVTVRSHTTTCASEAVSTALQDHADPDVRVACGIESRLDIVSNDSG